MSDNAAAYSLYFSPFSFPIFQSSTAVLLLRISPHPALNNLFGAFDIISVSAITARGGLACIDTLVPSFLIDDRSEASPSCEADVGTLKKGKLAL